MRKKVLFVCLGNICRSPMAEAVFNHHIEKLGLCDDFLCDSAGTAGYHEGGLPDVRTTKTLGKHFVSINHRARRIRKSDFEDFDLILAMDSSNYRNLAAMSGGESSKIRMMRSFDPLGPGDVPDPYYGTDESFEEVYRMCLRCCEPLMEYLSSGFDAIPVFS